MCAPGAFGAAAVRAARARLCALGALIDLAFHCRIIGLFFIAQRGLPPCRNPSTTVRPLPPRFSRRELIAGAGIGSAALLLDQAGVQAQPAARRPVVFTHTTVANAAAVQDDVALAVVGDKIAAIGPTDAILRQYRQCRNL